MFSELLNNTITITNLVSSHKNLEKKITYVSNLLWDYMTDEKLENWELKSPITTLIESYYCLLQLKRLVSTIITDPKITSMKIIKFSELEKQMFKIYIGNLVITKKTLKTKFNLFLEPIEYC